MAIDDITTTQLSEILGQICSTARSFDELLIDMPDFPGAHSLRCIAQNMGFLADLGLSKIGSIPSIGGAEDWFLPPSYHDAAGDKIAEGVAHE